MMTTFIPAAEVGEGFATPSAATSANAMLRTASRTGPLEDARWAPLWGTSKILASSPPEHRAVARDDGGWCRLRQEVTTAWIVVGRRVGGAPNPGMDRGNDPGVTKGGHPTPDRFLPWGAAFF